MKDLVSNSVSMQDLFWNLFRYKLAEGAFLIVLGFIAFMTTQDHFINQEVTFDVDYTSGTVQKITGSNHFSGITDMQPDGHDLLHKPSVKIDLQRSGHTLNWGFASNVVP